MSTAVDGNETEKAHLVQAQEMSRAEEHELVETPEEPFWPGVKKVGMDKFEKDENINIEYEEYSHFLQFRMMPGDVVTTIPGSIVLLSPGLTTSISRVSTERGLMNFFCSGEGVFHSTVENQTNEQKFLEIASQSPGKLIPIDLGEYSGIAIRSGSFVAAKGKDWSLDLEKDNVSSGCMSEDDFELNRLHGSGTAFISAGGAVQKWSLKENEEILVNPENLLAFEKSVAYSIQVTKNTVATSCCNDSHVFNILLRGPGMVLVESMPREKLVKAVSEDEGCLLEALELVFCCGAGSS